MIFYVGLHQPTDAKHFPRACISVRRLQGRQKPLGCPDVLIDSGAFTELEMHGGYQAEPAVYARELRRLFDDGVAAITAAVAQDFMCEPFMLAKTGLTVEDHQRLTIERYDALLDCGLPVPVMPVLQGYDPVEYARHLEAYGDRLERGAWVGVGSVCKRNVHPRAVLAVLEAIARERPDLRLHGFGVKTTALRHPGVRALLYSADSMAWSYSARKQGRNGNDWQEGMRFAEGVNSSLRPEPWQPSML